jgi:hypothetical protein
VENGEMEEGDAMEGDENAIMSNNEKRMKNSKQQ